MENVKCSINAKNLHYDPQKNIAVSIHRGDNFRSKPIEAALYARVSSEKQANAQTIESQLAALRQSVADDEVPLPADREFVDDGYTGATLVRPALERLRDLAAGNGVDRIYVHSPDRLARNYAYQVLLLDEWRRFGVEVVFLNGHWAGVQKMICCCRCRVWWLSTKGRKSWNGAGGASVMPPSEAP